MRKVKLNIDDLTKTQYYAILDAFTRQFGEAQYDEWELTANRIPTKEFMNLIRK
jgi:hypothetical protein